MWQGACKEVLPSHLAEGDGIQVAGQQLQALGRDRHCACQPRRRLSLLAARRISTFIRNT